MLLHSRLRRPDFVLPKSGKSAHDHFASAKRVSRMPRLSARCSLTYGPCRQRGDFPSAVYKGIGKGPCGAASEGICLGRTRPPRFREANVAAHVRGGAAERSAKMRSPLSRLHFLLRRTLTGPCPSVGADLVSARESVQFWAGGQWPPLQDQGHPHRSLRA